MAATQPLRPRGFQISSRTVRRQHHGMGFHGQEAASESHFTKCKSHWTLVETTVETTRPVKYRTPYVLESRNIRSSVFYDSSGDVCFVPMCHVLWLMYLYLVLFPVFCPVTAFFPCSILSVLVLLYFLVSSC